MRRYLPFFFAAIAALAMAPVAMSAADSDIRGAMNAWIAAVADKKSEDLTSLVAAEGEAYYLHIRDLALTAKIDELAQLGEIDQLQVMFYRLMIDSQQLGEMSGRELLGFAVENGFIGMELRRADLLDEIQIEGDRAEGRLYKFGRADRPDRYRQYFVKERGIWRVSLQGELERLEGEFDSFVQRSGLSRSEAAFLILETRVMRKVTPADFLATADQLEDYAPRIARETPAIEATDRFRLVSVRLPQTVFGRPAATVDDTQTGLKYVLQPGDHIPGYAELKLNSIAPGEAVFDTSADPGHALVLRLDPTDKLGRRKSVAAASVDSVVTIFDEARLGAKYPGQMMVQWRNIGLRGRPQLLQQAWLTPDFGGDVGPDKSMHGLRVRQVKPASFWHQIGLEAGDLLVEMNGVSVDTLDAWKRAIQIAETKQELKVRLQRGNNELVFHTMTVRPG